MKRRQHALECALFAACAATGRDYEAVRKRYETLTGRSWADSGSDQWVEFMREELGLDMTVAHVTNVTPSQNLYWGAERWVTSVFPYGVYGNSHVAYINQDNMVDDGCFEEPLPFPRYVRLLGERMGGVITRYDEVRRLP